MKPGGVYCVIPVRNRTEHTRACLDSLRSQSKNNMHIIVVDHGRSNATRDMIRTQFPEVTLLRGDEALWWAGAVNIGIRHVLHQAPDPEAFVLLLNNDVTLPSEFLEKLTRSAGCHPNSLIGSVALSGEDRSTILDGGVRINWRTAKYQRLNFGRSYDSQPGGRTEEVDLLSGRATLIPVGVFRKVGLPDEHRLPHYGADYEFSARAKRAGFNLLIDYGCFALNDPRTTGLRTGVSPFTWRQRAASLFSMRSPNNLYRRWNFARLACPRHLLVQFFLLDVSRVVAGSLRHGNLHDL